MKKKVTLVCLAFCIACLCLVGCGGKSAGTEGESMNMQGSESTSQSTSDMESAKDSTHGSLSNGDSPAESTGTGKDPAGDASTGGQGNGSGTSSGGSSSGGSSSGGSSSGGSSSGGSSSGGSSNGGSSSGGSSSGGSSSGGSSSGGSSSGGSSSGGSSSGGSADSGSTTEEKDPPVTVPENEPINSLNIARGINISLLESSDKVNFWLNGFITKKSTYEDIKAQGFDHIRLPVNFHTYYSGGKLDDSFMKKLDSILETILDCGLTVILDFHGWGDINGDVTACKAEFLDIWAQVSERYKDYSYALLFELINEPYEAEGRAPFNAQRLNAIQNEAISTVRKTNPKRIIVAAGPEWNAWWGLEDLELPANDPNIIVDVHTYQPMDFTHQGSERWTDPNAEVEQVRLYDGVLREIDKAVKGCKDFTARTGIKVWLGEFGVYLEIADEGDVTRYLSYVTDSMEKAGIPWAYWEYNSGFGAYNKLTRKWKAFVLEGLIKK